jgi:hypothetical protein
MSTTRGLKPADSAIEALQPLVEGMYALQEWHTSGGVFRPPQVEGRFVLLNGALVLVLHNRIQKANQTTVASYGSFVLAATQFSYRYEETSTFTQTPSGITVSPKAPWEGMRSFSASREGDVVRLRAGNGQQEFLFTAEGLTYSENGKVLRVWRRVTSKQHDRS